MMYDKWRAFGLYPLAAVDHQRWDPEFCASLPNTYLYDDPTSQNGMHTKLLREHCFWVNIPCRLVKLTKQYLLYQLGINKFDQDDKWCFSKRSVNLSSECRLLSIIEALYGNWCSLCWGWNCMLWVFSKVGTIVQRSSFYISLPSFFSSFQLSCLFLPFNNSRFFPYVWWRLLQIWA